MIFTLNKACYLVFALIISTVALCLFASSASAATITWDGGGGDNNWSTGLNWSGDTAPGVSDDVVFDSTSTKDATVDSSFGGIVNSLSINSGYTGSITTSKALTAEASFSQAAGTFTLSTGNLTVGSPVDAPFTITGGTFNAGSRSMDIYGDINISNCTFTASSNDMNVHKDFVIGSGVTYDDNDGNMTFWDGTSGSYTIDVDSSATFYEIFFYGDTWELAAGDVLYIEGSLDISSVDALNAASGAEFHLRGDIAFLTTSATSTASFIIDGTGDQTWTGTSGYSDITINKTAGTLTFAPTGARTHASDITLTAGDIVVNGGSNDSDFTGTFTMNGGSITVNSNDMNFQTAFVQNAGAVTVASGGYILNDGTLDLDGGTFTIESGGTLDSYNTITIDGGTVTNDGWFYFDDFALESGTLDLSTGEVYFYASTVANNGGTVIAGASSYTEPDSSLSSLTLTGDWNFYDFTSTDASSTITFEAGSMYTVSGTLTLTGGSGTEINLVSSSPGTAWNLDLSGSSSVSYVDVADSEARWGTFINAANSTDSGNNYNWFTPARFAGESKVQIPPKTYYIDLTIPESDLSLSPGDVYEITWNTSGSGPTSAVDLSYTTDEGLTYNTIATTQEDDGAYSWTVPGIAAESIQIRVQGTDLVDPVSEDTSHLIYIVQNETEEPEEPEVPVTCGVEGITIGDFVRSAEFPAVYYISGECSRKVFLNSQTFFTWADNFDSVKTISSDDLNNYELVGVMLPQPGVVLVKIQSDPKVYTIEEDENGDYLLRWIHSEALAIEMYGENWADYVIDLEATTFARYKQGPDATLGSPDHDPLKLKKRVDLHD